MPALAFTLALAFTPGLDAHRYGATDELIRFTLPRKNHTHYSIAFRR